MRDSRHSTFSLEGCLRMCRMLLWNSLLMLSLVLLKLLSPWRSALTGLIDGEIKLIWNVLLWKKSMVVTFLKFVLFSLFYLCFCILWGKIMSAYYYSQKSSEPNARHFTDIISSVFTILWKSKLWVWGTPMLLPQALAWPNLYLDFVKRTLSWRSAHIVLQIKCLPIFLAY